MIRVFNFYLSKGVLLLLAVEAMLLFAAVPLGVHSRFQGVPWGPDSAIVWTNAAIFLVLGLVALSVFGALST